MADDPTTTGEKPAPSTSSTTGTGTTSVSSMTITPLPITGPAQPITADPPADDFDKERALALIAKLRDEVKEAKAQAKDGKTAQERLAEIEREKLTERERLQAERDEATAERDRLRETNRENAVKLAVFAAQQEKGIADADLALAALDRTKIEFGDDGRPTNVGELLDDLLERKPLLKGAAPKPPIPPTDGPSGGSNPPDLTAAELEAAELAGQDPARYAAIKRLRERSGDGRTVSVADAIAALYPK